PAGIHVHPLARPAGQGGACGLPGGPSRGRRERAGFGGGVGERRGVTGREQLQRDEGGQEQDGHARDELERRLSTLGGHPPAAGSRALLAETESRGRTGRSRGARTLTVTSSPSR